RRPEGGTLSRSSLRTFRIPERSPGEGVSIHLKFLLSRIFSVSPQVAFLLRRGERSFASQTEGEIRVTRVLQQKFPQAVVIKVVDISGGCGAMYEIHIESEEFKEKRTIQQHQMVNQVSRWTLTVWEFYGTFGFQTFPIIDSSRLHACLSCDSFALFRCLIFN
uniref:BolA family member 3 n=1 Tax=Laticauda laticaudata TaxID=8630 RepID=A0A8C5SBS8_LATLA